MNSLGVTRDPSPPIPSARWRSTAWACLGLLLFSAATSCTERHADMSASSSAEDRCVACHGDPARSGDFLQRSAPPNDLSGGTDPSFPGVGAHQLHLQASSSHAAIACTECHLVPDRVDAPGHADHGSPATLVFGALASSKGSTPSYDSKTRTCQSSYCHGSAHAVWNAPRTSSEACGSCHGLPPPLPHPQSERCSACHGAVVDEQNRIIRAELHVNGQVESSDGQCTTCHGSGDDPAPPRDTTGHTAQTAIGVGAHQAHLASTLGRSLACSECHQVPEKAEDEGHIEGLPARVQLVGVAATEKHVPVWRPTERTCTDSWCHGPSPGGAQSSPSWTEPVTLGCTSCHGSPPPAPHPQSEQCSACHARTVGSDNHTIIDLKRHVNGVVDVQTTKSCTACHGDVNPAPPRALDGETATTFSGVGAHQTHVLGTARSRPVPCQECHRVPAKVLADGHLDSARPAEVIFSGAAVATGTMASYAGGACQNTACHGAQWPSGNDSGGSLTEPVWTKVDGSQSACGTCHGLPPPPPHPYGSLNPVCSACHEDIASDNRSFVRPDLHADGVVTFSVP